jgi:hypothetical protein
MVNVQRFYRLKVFVYFVAVTLAKAKQNTTSVRISVSLYFVGVKQCQTPWDIEQSPLLFVIRFLQVQFP